MSSAITTLQQLPEEIRWHRLEALVTASESLNRATGLDDILHVILDLISTQLNCERATVFLHDRRTGRLHARQMSGAQQIEIVLERGMGIAGHVAESGESVVINDVQTDPRFDRATDLRTGFVTRSMLCVALRKPDGALLGSLQAINAVSGAFSPADMIYLESFAALAAVAVEREQLGQEAMRAQLLSTELDLAHKIQQRLLPAPGEINLPVAFTAWGVSQACYDVGGDAYDVVPLPNGECAFWVADVSGKGIGAALLMTTLQTELRALVRSESNLARLANELNAKVNRVAPLGTYATLFLGVLSAAEGLLRYVNAGHLPPIWINRQNAEERYCAATGMPIGLLPGTAYEAGACAFFARERLAVFSDGVTDAENVAGETYETENLTASLAPLRAEPIAEIGARVFADLDRFRMGAPAKDDTTFLAIGLA